MLRNFLIIILLSLLFSCRIPGHIGFNQPITMSMAVPDGPPEFKSGWYHGCISGLGNKRFANSFIYQGEKGVDFGNGLYQHDPVFQTAWSQGWFACTIHSAIFTARSSMQFGPLQ